MGQQMTGLFGVVSADNCISSLYYGTDYHSHLGTEYGGLAFLNSKGDPIKKIHEISNSQFKSKFYEGSDQIRSKFGIGAISDRDPQPLVFTTKFGTMALCCAGLISNSEELSKSLIDGGETFAETLDGRINTAELVATLICQRPTLEEGIRDMNRRIEGSINFLMLKEDGVYAYRDTKGILPLAIGKNDNEYAVASEDFSFPNLGMSRIKQLGPGELVKITPEGIDVLIKPETTSRTCAFLWIYTGFPASTYEGISVEKVRERCGAFLAKRDNVEADLAAGVPDSGTSHAIGYAMESGLPFRRVLVKYTPGYGRSYLPLDQGTRDRIALMKLIPNESIIEGKRIILCEDSIVRGTQLKNYTIQKLRKAGAKEVHVRVACPPLMFPCRYALSTRSIEELAARRAIKALEGSDNVDIRPYLDPDTSEYKEMVRWIEDDIGLDSLMYLRIDDMKEAISLPGNRLCTHCWDGSE